MKELVELIAKKLVDHPEDVQVRMIEGDGGFTVELHVNPGDMGKVIGREGRTAKAMRTLLNSAAAKAECNADLTIAE